MNRYIKLFFLIVIFALNCNIILALDDVLVENNINIDIDKSFTAVIKQEMILNLLNDKTASKIDTGIELHSDYIIQNISTNQGDITNLKQDTRMIYFTLENISWTKRAPLKILITYTLSKFIETNGSINYFDFGYKAFGENSQQIPTNYLVNLNISFPYGTDPKNNEKYLAYFGLPNYDKDMSVEVYSENPFKFKISKNVNINTKDFLFRFIFLLFDKPSFGIILNDEVDFEKNNIDYTIKLTNTYPIENVYYSIINNKLLVTDTYSKDAEIIKPRYKLDNETEVIHDKRDMVLEECSSIYRYIYPFECYILSNNYNIASEFDPDIKPIDFNFNHDSTLIVPTYYVIIQKDSFISYSPEMIRFPKEMVITGSKWRFNIFSSPITTLDKVSFHDEKTIHNKKFRISKETSLHHPQYTTNILTQIKFRRSYLTIILSIIVAILPIFWLFIIRHHPETKKSVYKKNKKLYYGGMIAPVIVWFTFYSMFFNIGYLLKDLVFWMLIIIVILIFYWEFIRKS